MPHAILRFQERIENLTPEEIQTWADQAWRERKGKYARKSGRRSLLLVREFKGERREYLAARAPGGKPVYLALSLERDAALTVLDTMQWNTFIGTRPSIKARIREDIMAQLLARDEKTIG